MQVPPPLVRLMSRTFEIPVSSTDEALPVYDLFCTLMSLPYALGMAIDTVPFSDRYLAVDPDIVAGWRAVLDRDLASRLAERPSRRPPLKVGLVWSGAKRPWHTQTTLMDERRSTNLCVLAPLARCADGISFYSLQIGGPAAEAASPPPGLPVIDHTRRIGDFADTAGLVSLLDLVIAVDTSTAHLALADRAHGHAVVRYHADLHPTRTLRLDDPCRGDGERSRQAHRGHLTGDRHCRSESSLGTRAAGDFGGDRCGPTSRSTRSRPGTSLYPADQPGR